MHTTYPLCFATVAICAGAAPFFMSETAMKKLKGRKSKVAKYMLDMNLVGDYWGWYGKRWYHHTYLHLVGSPPHVMQMCLR